MNTDQTDNPFHAPASGPQPGPQIAPKPLTVAALAAIVGISMCLASAFVPVTLLAEIQPGHFFKPETPIAGLCFTVLTLVAVCLVACRHRTLINATIIATTVNFFAWICFLILIHYASLNGLTRSDWPILVLFLGGSLMLSLFVGFCSAVGTRSAR